MRDESERQDGSAEVTRAAVFFDAGSIPISRVTARRINRRVDELMSEWLRGPRFGEEPRRVKRMYAPDLALGAGLLMNRELRWRLGGNGEAEDIVGFINSDSRAFCMECPEHSAAVFCSEDTALADVIEDIRDAGSEVFVVTRQGRLPDTLAAIVEPGHIGVL